VREGEIFESLLVCAREIVVGKRVKWLCVVVCVCGTEIFVCVREKLFCVIVCCVREICL